MMLRTCCGCTDKKPSPTHETTQTTSPVVNNQPSKRSSVTSHVKLEITDEDDDVFSEGVGPPIKLADNLAVRAPDGDPMPDWLIPEISVTTTDETDTKLHKSVNTEAALLKDALIRECLEDNELFELLTNKRQLIQCKDAPCNGGTKREIDTVSKCCLYDERYGIPAIAIAIRFEGLLGRLETVTARLESVCLSGLATPTAEDQPPPQPDQLSKELSNALRITAPSNMQSFMDIMAGPLAQYLSLSQQIGGDVAAHSQHVKNTFQAQLDFLHLASTSPQPANVTPHLSSTSKHLSAVQAFCESNRKSPLSNHLWAVSESIPALGWVTVSNAPAPYIKEFNDAGQFYGNRVLKEWKDKDKRHVDWVKAWVQTLTELQAFVKQHHTTGLVWAGKQAAGGIAPPPPLGGLPPPPIPINFDVLAGGDANDRSALFAQINQGQDITKSLKKVSSEMQTHKNSGLRTGPAPFKAPSAAQAGSYSGVVKSPVFKREGKKWIIEYQQRAHDLLVDGTEMSNVVYVYKCNDCCLEVKGKLNSITLDSCQRTSVLFDTLVSGVETINCQSIQLQVLGKVPTISIDKTDGCQMYLSLKSLDTEIISSKSSEMNVMVPSDGDYEEYPVPEQFKTTLPNGAKGGLKTITIENKD